MLAGLNDISGGGIMLAGKELAGAGPDRGVVFQSPCLLPWLTAFQNVMLGENQVFYTASKVERRQIAEYYLTVVGLSEALHKRPAELSQGMRQRKAYSLKTTQPNMSSITTRLPKTLAAAALVLSACGAAQAQYAPPPPSQPFPGFLNDWMRMQDPSSMRSARSSPSNRIRGSPWHSKEIFSGWPTLTIGFTP